MAISTGGPYDPIDSVIKPYTLPNGRKINVYRPKDQSSDISYSSTVQNLEAQLRQLQSSLRPATPASVDIAGINAQARAQAKNAVNPRYTKLLNDMLARQAVKRQRAQQDYQLGVQSIEDQLKQAQESSQIERGRTAEDTALATGQINTAEDQFQTAAGQEFDDVRLAEAEQLAAGGLTTSGIGRQQARRTIDQRNVGEAQQGAEFQTQRTAQAILKARTFEDLARSDVLAADRTTKGKEAEKLSLDRLLEDVTREEALEKFQIESDRLRDLATQSGQYSQQLFNKYLANIRDPRVLSATSQAYGSLF